MKRRTALIGSATVGAHILAGCLGSDTRERSDADRRSDDTDGIGGERESASDSTEIDPEAHYVVRGPEGYFSAKGPWNTDLDGVVIHGYDLVGYFEEDRPIGGSEDHEVVHDGVRFHFTSERNRETFVEDPSAYTPEFGGYCSLGVGNGYKDGMHPDAFDVIDGNLYFNLTPRIHEGWLRNFEARIETAEQNWPEIKHSTEPIHIGPGLP